jgi:hypothetical protein
MLLASVSPDAITETPIAAPATAEAPAAPAAEVTVAANDKADIGTDARDATPAAGDNTVANAPITPVVASALQDSTPAPVVATSQKLGMPLNLLPTEPTAVQPVSEVRTVPAPTPALTAVIPPAPATEYKQIRVAAVEPQQQRAGHAPLDLLKRFTPPATAPVAGIVSPTSVPTTITPVASVAATDTVSTAPVIAVTAETLPPAVAILSGSTASTISAAPITAATTTVAANSAPISAIAAPTAPVAHANTESWMSQATRSGTNYFGDEHGLYKADMNSTKTAISISGGGFKNTVIDEKGGRGEYHGKHFTFTYDQTKKVFVLHNIGATDAARFAGLFQTTLTVFGMPHDLFAGYGIEVLSAPVAKFGNQGGHTHLQGDGYIQHPPTPLPPPPKPPVPGTSGNHSAPEATNGGSITIPPVVSGSELFAPLTGMPSLFGQTPSSSLRMPFAEQPSEMRITYNGAPLSGSILTEPLNLPGLVAPSADQTPTAPAVAPHAAPLAPSGKAGVSQQDRKALEALIGEATAPDSSKDNQITNLKARLADETEELATARAAEAAAKAASAQAEAAEKQAEQDRDQALADKHDAETARQAAVAAAAAAKEDAAKTQASLDRANDDKRKIAKERDDAKKQNWILGGLTVLVTVIGGVLGYWLGLMDRKGNGPTGSSGPNNPITSFAHGTDGNEGSSPDLSNLSNREYAEYASHIFGGLHRPLKIGNEQGMPANMVYVDSFLDSPILDLTLNDGIYSDGVNPDVKSGAGELAVQPQTFAQAPVLTPETMNLLSGKAPVDPAIVTTLAMVDAANAAAPEPLMLPAAKVAKPFSLAASRQSPSQIVIPGYLRDTILPPDNEEPPVAPAAPPATPMKRYIQADKRWMDKNGRTRDEKGRFATRAGFVATGIELTTRAPKQKAAPTPKPRDAHGRFVRIPKTYEAAQATT